MLPAIVTANHTCNYAAREEFCLQRDFHRLVEHVVVDMISCYYCMIRCCLQRDLHRLVEHVVVDTWLVRGEELQIATRGVAMTRVELREVVFERLPTVNRHL